MNLPIFVQEEIERRIASGKYASSDEVLRCAFDALNELERNDDEILAGAMEGIAEIERGECMEADEVFAMLRERSKSLIDKSK
jgi:Arc/MetJ-type ribon-helix-helix transcriptional regulator